MDTRLDQTTQTVIPPVRGRLTSLVRAGALGRLGRANVVDGIVSKLPGTRAPLGAPRVLPKLFSGMWITFILGVVLPTAFAIFYYGFVASPIYVSEAKFAVRGAVEKLPAGGGAAAGPVSGLAGSLSAVNNNQDGYVVANYIRSTPLVEKLDRSTGLKDLLARNTVDFWARLSPDASREELTRKWDGMVQAAVDNVSGIITLQVKAYSAPDALRLANSVLAESEVLVNEISERRLTDSVKFAKEEVGRAEQRLQAARLAVQDFRNRSGYVDPIKQTEATLLLANALRTERIQLENELSAARRTLSEQAPSVQVLSARLKALTDQIAGLERLVTSQSDADKTASRALFQFEGLELERMFAEKLYLIAQAALERARMNAERQQLYLVTFVKPGLAETATLPHRAGTIVVVFVCTLALWSIVSLVTATVKDHFV